MDNSRKDLAMYRLETASQDLRSANILHNPQLRREYEAREKAVRDTMAQILTAVEDKTLAVIKNGLNMGIDHGVIAKMADVPLAKVEEIAKKMKIQ